MTDETKDPNWLKTAREALPQHLLAKNTKFAPKLTRDQRCAIIGLAYLGIKQNALATAFGVNLSTIRYMVRLNSPHYRELRREFQESGPERFIKTYVSEIHYEMLEAVAGDPELEMNQTQLRELRSSQGLSPSKRASAEEGKHRLTSPFGPEIVEVRWFENGEAPEYHEEGTEHPVKRTEGWYVIDGKGSITGSPKDANTSKQAFNAYKANTFSEDDK